MRVFDLNEDSVGFRINSYSKEVVHPTGYYKMKNRNAQDFVSRSAELTLRSLQPAEDLSAAPQ